LIGDICSMVSLSLPPNPDDCMIRTAINDLIDHKNKEGIFPTPDNYSQKRAVARVRRLLKRYAEIDRIVKPIDVQRAFGHNDIKTTLRHVLHK